MRARAHLNGNSSEGDEISDFQDQQIPGFNNEANYYLDDEVIAESSDSGNPHQVDIANQTVEQEINMADLIKECGFPSCDFLTSKDNTLMADALKELELHIKVEHELQRVQQQAARTENALRGKQKIGSCTTWTEKMSFEEWKLDLDIWEKLAKKEQFDEDTLLHLLKESLKATPNNSVKVYYEEVIIKDGQSAVSWTKIVKRLKDKFGRDQDEEWTQLVIKTEEFKWGERKTAEVWEELEKTRLLRQKLTKEVVEGSNPPREQEDPKITKLLDKMLILQFLIHGKI